MGAHEELATTGHAGPQTTAMMEALVLAAVHAQGFLPPTGFDRWTPYAVEATVAQLIGTPGTGFLLTCWARSTDDDSLAAVAADLVVVSLERAAIGWTAEHVAQQLDTVVLPGDPHVVRTVAPVGWGLPGRGHWDQSLRPVVSAALRATAVPTHDRVGMATKPVLLALTVAALAAAGAMTTAELAAVIVARLAPSPRRVPRPMLVDGLGESVSPLLDGPEPGFVVSATAEEIWASLTPLQRTLVPHLGLPVGDLAAVIELPGAMAEVAADGLVQRLREACADDDRAAEVLVRLRVLCTERP